MAHTPESRRAWKAKRKAAGLCYQCGKPSGGPNLCPECRDKAKPYLAKSQKNRRPYLNRWARNKASRDKSTVFAHYGDKCICCGEAQFEFLTIDHSERNGSVDPRCHYAGKPRHFRITGGRWYAVIIKLGFP